MSSGDNGTERASTARRKALLDADVENGTLPLVSNFFPLERYYDAADKLHLAFRQAFEDRQLDEAYVYGMRYCTFCFKGLVQHDYYKSPKFSLRRKTTQIQAEKVISDLEQVAIWMDAQEEEKIKQEKIRRQKIEEERMRRHRELEAKRYAEIQNRIEHQKNSSIASNGESDVSAVRESALAKLIRMQNNQNDNNAADQSPMIPTTPNNKNDRPEEPEGKSFLVSPPDPEGQQRPLPAPIPPPIVLPDSSSDPSTTEQNGTPAPPSYHEVLEKSKFLQQNSYFGPGRNGVDAEPSSSASDAQKQFENLTVQQKPQKKKSHKKMPISQLRSLIERKYHEYQQQGKIQVSNLGTYQGRVRDSTNGCTVISALVAARHLETHGGVADAQINKVIDRDCGPILRQIRSKLGLGSGSLIIPSDVHDHLVDEKILHQSKFVGAAGGNILDDGHMGELLSLLQGTFKDPVMNKDNKCQPKKAAATLFYHEHVVSIVKFPTSPTDAVYDLVDSLPRTWSQSGWGMSGSRTRCHGIAALKILIAWYACNKLSDANCKYIDRNQWNEAMADFDPRVFQAFVWADI